MFAELFTPEQLTILTQIILIDLVLAGDNAIIIGMVASKFPLEQRRKIIIFGIGGAVVLTELEPSLRTLHLFLAQLIIFTLGVSLISLYVPADKKYSDILILDKYSIIIGVLALTTIISVLTGSYAVWKGAGTVCSSWPLCTTNSLLPQSSLGWIHMIHRIASSLTGIIGLIGLYIILRRKFSNSIYMISVSLKLQNSIHHMLKNFRSCNRPIFINMSNQ